MSTRNTKVAAHAAARGIPSSVTRAVQSVNEPSPVIEPEIHRELGHMDDATRNMSMVIDELIGRLEPIMAPQIPMDESAAEPVCVTHIGHRIREHRAATEANWSRLRNLIDRLAV